MVISRRRNENANENGSKENTLNKQMNYSRENTFMDITCNGNVFRRDGDGHVLRRVLDFEVECQSKKRRSNEEKEVEGRKAGQTKKMRSKVGKRSKEEREVKGRKGGQRKKGRSKEEREVKGRKGGQRKKGRSKEEMEAKEDMQKAG